MVWVLVGLAVVFAIAVFKLRGTDFSQFDLPPGESFDAGHEPSDEHDQVVASLDVGSGPIQRAPRSKRLALMRAYMDDISSGLDLSASFSPVDAGGVPAEWVQAPGTDPRRRVLYIHGGAFTMGSPRSHRNITNRFSEITGGAVLAIDYRLMPENPRSAGVSDCRSAYRWLLENGPEGPSELQRLYVAGDSAGGNLTLALTPWIRDLGLRAPDGVVALSPVTDFTLGSPSLTTNIDTDAMLGPLFKGLAKVPKPLLLGLSWIQNRMSPFNPVISPIYGDLSRLPPTLVQASEAEILFDDARRYVNRAAAAGSPVRLQSWAHVVHVWQMFYPQLTEARQAWDEIAEFIEDCG